jgi:hypothetical protein
MPLLFKVFAVQPSRAARLLISASLSGEAMARWVLVLPLAVSFSAFPRLRSIRLQ